jgi:hypothetical protein
MSFQDVEGAPHLARIMPSLFLGALGSGKLKHLCFNAMVLSEHEVESIARATQEETAHVELLSFKGCELKPAAIQVFAHGLSSGDGVPLATEPRGLFRYLHTLNLAGNHLGMNGKAALGRVFLQQPNGRGGKSGRVLPLEVFIVNEWRIMGHTRVLALSTYIPSESRRHRDGQVTAVHRSVPCHQYQDTCRHRLLAADLVLIAGVLHLCEHVDTLQLCGQPVCGVGWIRNNLMRVGFHEEARPAKFVEGQSVVANYRGAGTWYSGHVTKCHSDTNTYDIEFEDGDRDTNVIRKHIRTDFPEGNGSKSKISGFDWQGIKALAQVIRHDGHLTALDLSCIELGGWNGLERPGVAHDLEGLTALAQSLQGNCQKQALKELNLSRNCIQPAGCLIILIDFGSLLKLSF